MTWLKEKPDEKNKNIKFFIHSEEMSAQDLRRILWEKCREAKIKPEILTSPIVDQDTGDFLEVVTLEITSENGKAQKAKKIAEELLGLGIEGDTDEFLKGIMEKNQ